MMGNFERAGRVQAALDLVERLTAEWRVAQGRLDAAWEECSLPDVEVAEQVAILKRRRDEADARHAEALRKLEELLGGGPG